MNEFGFEKQKLLIRYLITESTIFQRSRNILKPSYFAKELQPVIKFILEYAEKFSSTPSVDQIKAETGILITKINEIKDSDINYALENIELFCQTEAVIAAVWDAPNYIEEGNRGKVFEVVKKAMEVGLQKDLGTDYFDNPRDRLERMKNNSFVPTGWYIIDKKLYGGLNRGELTIFTAGSGIGKSLFLQNICLNWVEGAKYRNWKGEEKTWNPLNVVYITLELSEELTSKRLDTMITGIDAREIFKKIDDVELKVRMKSKNCGHFQIKYMSAGSTCNDIAAYLKEYEIQNERKVDALVVDYLDLLHPNSKKINLNDLYTKDKFTTEELRSLAADFDVLCVSASQLNRSAVDESEHSQAMIGGGLSKIQTADNVISIYASAAMKERGEYSLQFLKTRSSSGIGHKVQLGFDQISLRIYNFDENYESKNDKDKLRAEASNSKSIISANNSNSAILNIIKQGPPIANKQNISEKEKQEKIEDNNKVEKPMERLKRLQDSGKI